LYYIHSFSDITNRLEIREGLYYGGDFDEICEQIKNSKNPNKEIRFFVGYSGWSPGQLDKEIKNESWITANNISTEDILDTKLDDLWRICLEKQGQRFQLMTKFPRNPMDN
jgi:putative transcriptional regulator